MSVMNQSAAAVMGLDRASSTVAAATSQNMVPQTPASQTASLFDKLSLPDRHDYSSRINSINSSSSSSSSRHRPQISSEKNSEEESNYATSLQQPARKHSDDVDDSDDSLQGSVSSLATVEECAGTRSSVQGDVSVSVSVTAGAAALSPPQQPIVSSSPKTSQPLQALNSAAAAQAHAALQLSLLYPDTAPRTTWRPQLNAWMKKNHPSMLKEIAQTTTSSVSVPTSSRSHSTNNHNYLLQRKEHHLHSPNHHHQAKRPLHEPVKPYARPDEPRIPSPPHSPNLYLPAASSSLGSTSTQINAPPSPPHTASPKSPQLRDEPQYTISTFVVAGYNMQPKRCCISCGSDQSPCWRPSWSVSAGQLCNSCGLRYKKTGARCVSSECGRIPAKGEWVTMKRNAVMGDDGALQYSCLTCGGDVEVGERND